MPYHLQAVVGGFDQLRRDIAELRMGLVAPLEQHMGLVPVTTSLIEELSGSKPTRNRGMLTEERPFSLVSAAFEQLLSEWSHGGPVAYVEADFHGGHGRQSAAVWRAGARVPVPALSWNFSGPWQDWPINAALALLGVVPGDDSDLFLTVELGHGSDEDDWKWMARRALWAATYDEWHEEREGQREEWARAAEEADKYRRRTDVPVILDGTAVMEVLGIPSGPMVGAAIRHLQDWHVERGSAAREEAVQELRAWAARQGADA
ncbi:hypothetical protein [Nonomuraea sp. B19D2]|uniref:hypothetical protein n=1 Tax=Nonomuraea sp. B19D2 TaxID=3159561 RepID=UPI0032DB85CE